MTAYIIRRSLYAIPILIGVNVITFLLFFFVNSPEDMARAHLGHKRVTPEQIDRWKRERSLDLPYFYNDGWRRIGSLPAVSPQNESEFPTAGTGSYTMEVETPEAEKAAQRRTLRIQCSQPERLVLPEGFDAEGKMVLPPETSTRRLLFRIAPSKSREELPPSLRITFGLESPAPTHRVLLEFQGDIAFLSRLTQTIFFQRSVKMLFFQYGKSDDGKDIGEEILQRIGPSLSITVPVFLLGLFIDIFFAWGSLFTGEPTWITGGSSCASS